MSIQLRKSQEAVIAYEEGLMGVSAVPGAGKTTTLSYLAASLVEKLTARGLADEQEVLIVTLTNSAVNSFRGRIAKIVQQERGLLPYIGYRVRTLHSLANDIVRMRPGLVGLNENFDIIDERISANIIDDLAGAWMRHNAHRLTDYVNLPMAESEEQLLWRIRKSGGGLIRDIAYETIRLAKDNLWEPDMMREAFEDLPPTINPTLAAIGVEMYEGYQRALQMRGAVDFDDLVRLAMQALKTDRDFLERLQRKWPYILEDEAQDSSQLQEQMLQLLSGERNWVRVGDPNQSIFTTFTTANANLLRAFVERDDVQARPLPKSGRSSRSIINVANYLVEWTSTDPDVPALNDALTRYPLIEPTPPGDPQKNPDDGLIYVDFDPNKNMTPEAEVERVGLSLQRYLGENPNKTAAVLVPANSRGFKVAEELRKRGVPYEELLRSTSATRSAAARLYIILAYLEDPTNAKALARIYFDVWWPYHTGADQKDPNDDGEVETIDPTRDQMAQALRHLDAVERYLWPSAEGDWLDTLSDIDEATYTMMRAFREQVRGWLEAITLPVDQLILTIAQEIFATQPELALAHKMAVVLKSIANDNPDYRLPELSRELRTIANNERRFIGFDDAAAGFEPQKGVVTIATMHAAKGLEWDRVYLMSVTSYDFPSGQPGDSYMSEKWFIRDDLNIQAEARHQLRLIMEGRPEAYIEGEASTEARIAYSEERLRLLYVGITRAREDLILMWNMGRFWNEGKKNAPAQAMLAIQAYLQQEAT